MSRFLPAGAVLLALCACQSEPVDTSPPGAWTEAELRLLGRLRLVDELPADPSNRYVGDPAAITFGRALFFDLGLSGTGGVNCASCHRPDQHFADRQVLSNTLGPATRHTPSIVGSQQGPWFFWDGRADSLWAQALGPIENPIEMGGNRMEVARYVTVEKADLYRSAFGEPPDLTDASRFPDKARPHATGDAAPHARAWEAMQPEDRALVDGVFANIGKAIGAYEATLLPHDAPFDHYVDAVLAGDPTGGGHLSEEQVLGLDLFIGKAGCVLCHNGPMFTDRAFHNNGVIESRPGYDPGRRSGAPMVLGSEFNCRGAHSDAERCDELDYLDPSFDDFLAAFKTPSLRYVDQTPPYFHNGSRATLEDVIDFYSDLDDPPPVGHRELTLKTLELDQAERAALIAFMHSLTGEPVSPYEN